MMNKSYNSDILDLSAKTDFTNSVSEIYRMQSGGSEVRNYGAQRRKILENLLLMSFRYWFPLGTVDPLVLSYLILVVKILFDKGRIIGEWRITNLAGDISIHPKHFANE